MDYPWPRVRRLCLRINVHSEATGVSVALLGRDHENRVWKFTAWDGGCRSIEPRYMDGEYPGNDIRFGLSTKQKDAGPIVRHVGENYLVDR